MRYTLIQMVQRILESMDSDEVNDIADTPESIAVANIIKECYFNIVSELAAKDTETLFHLDASLSSDLPTVMFLPDTASNIKYLRYNIGTSLADFNLRDITYLPLGEFLNFTNGLDETVSWVETQVVPFPSGDFHIKLRNDEFPHYWTSVDDRTLLFDSYDKSTESTLTSSRTYVYGDRVVEFQLTNTFVPDLDPRHFQLLINAAKAQAFIELKQTENALAGKKERRNWLLAKKSADSTDPRSEVLKHYPGFGRHRH